MLDSHSSLSAADLAAVADLERRVVAADGGRLKLEWSVLRNRDGDVVRDLLWREDGQVLGFCGIYAFGGPAELAGMVDPAARRRGIGSALLGAARDLVDADAPTLLVTPRTTSAGREFAAAHGAVHEHSEHHLVLVGTPPAPTRHGDVVVRDAIPADRRALRALLAAAFGDDPDDHGGDGSLLAGDRQLVAERNGSIVGALRVSGDGDRRGVYGFAVSPELQGQGIGRVVLARVCRELRDMGVADVTLEVAVDNDNALGLYTSLGFERRATEDYYRLPG